MERRSGARADRIGPQARPAAAVGAATAKAGGWIVCVQRQSLGLGVAWLCAHELARTVLPITDYAAPCDALLLQVQR